MKFKLRVRSWILAKRTVILLGAIAVGLLDLMWVTTVARDAQGFRDASPRTHEVEFQMPPGGVDRFL